MGKRLKHSYDDLSSSDENLTNDNTHCHHSITDDDDDTTVWYDIALNRRDNDNFPNCKKCGHQLTLSRQFTNAFS